MAARSLKVRLNEIPASAQSGLRPLMEATLDDLKELRAKFNLAVADLSALRASITGITAKLDLDAGVTDTNYAATQNPAALTTSAAAPLKLED